MVKRIRRASWDGQSVARTGKSHSMSRSICPLRFSPSIRTVLNTKPQLTRRHSAEGYGVRAVKQFHRHLSTMQAVNLAATSGHASNDKRSADISSLDNLRIK